MKGLINKISSQRVAILSLSKRFRAFYYHGEDIEIQSGQMILLKNEDASFSALDDSPIINIDRGLIIGFFEFISANYEKCRYNYNNIPIHFISKCSTPSIFEEAVRLSWYKGSHIDDEKEKALVYYLLSFFLEHKNIITFFSYLIKTKTSEDIYRLISKSPQDKWSLKKVADYFAMSESTLKKTLHNEGTSYTKLLVKCRMYYAKKLIYENTKNIEQVAIKCGYKNTSYFIFSFHKFYGYTPYQYKMSLFKERKSIR